MGTKLELELSTLLPDGHDDGDGCMDRLSEALARTPGVDEAHIVTGADGPAQLCLHYDRDALTVSTLRELAFRAGAEITDRYGHVVWQASGLKRPRRAERITAELERVPGVLEARAWSDGPLRIEFDREQIGEQDLRAQLAGLGVRVQPDRALTVPPGPPAPTGEHRPSVAEGEEHHHGGLFGDRSELIFAIACGVFLAVGFGLSFVSAAPQWLSLVFYLLSFATGGYFTAREAFESIRAGRFAIDLLMLVAALAMAVSINPSLALVLLTVIPVMALSIGILMKVCGKLFEIMQQRIDALNNTVQENLVAIRVVKAFVRAGYEKTKFQASNDALTDAALEAVMRIILMQPIMILCFNIATAGVLWVGGRQVMGGTMLIGDLSSFLNYIFQVLMSVMMVAMALLHLSRAQASARRIVEVLDAVPDIRDCVRPGQVLPAPRGKVEFRDVSFRYSAGGSGDDVLSHLSFSVEPGQFVALVGGTGTGKSSLVNLIPRFYDVTGGAVLVDGTDVREFPLEALRSRIGMVLQNNLLFSGTIRENLLWGKADATEEEMIQAARDAQAYDFIMSFPDGFDTLLDQGGVNVSGGQKQRLCIARAMLRQPSILILDDSTSAVDTQTEALIRASFRANLAGTTVIIIAQRISSVEHADRILVLDDGAIAGEGTHEGLLASNSIYQEIYKSQQEGVAE